MVARIPTVSSRFLTTLQRAIPAMSGSFKSPRLLNSKSTPTFLTRNFASRPPVVSYPGTPITDANPGPIVDKEFVVVNVDSGAGGAAAQSDEVKYVQNAMRAISSEYHAKFKMVHIGDAYNAPFGGKPVPEILQLTKGLLREGAKTYGADLIVIACNTASTTNGPNLRGWINGNIPGTEVFEIIKPTAKELYLKGDSVDVGGSKEIHIAVLSTPATTKSGLYPLELAVNHYKTHGSDCITVVRSNIDVPTLPRVYQGQLPIARDSREETALLEQVSKRSSLYPVLFVHAYAPPDWVSLLEGKVPDKTEVDLKEEVMGNAKTYVGDQRPRKQGDMQKFFIQIGADLGKVTAIGLCCTHYPILEKYILDAFSERDELRDVNLTENVKVVPQGKIIAEQMIIRSLQKAVSNGVFTRRDKIDWTRPAYFLQQESRTTGYVGDPSSEQSLKVVKEIFRRGGPLSEKTNCTIVPPHRPVGDDE